MTISVNGKRLLDNLYSQGRIGWIKGEGLQRISYTPSYDEAREWLRYKMDEAGLKTRIDGVGNLFGVLDGETSSTILVGSHMDSVNNGGIYDGALGVLSALEAITTIKENNITMRKTLEVVAFIAEEGEPLGGTFGSRAFAGLLPDGYKRDLVEGLGITDNAVKTSRGNLENYSAFLELHIEQGPYLERKGLDIGIPSGIVGIARYEVTINGVANHAGTTPMYERKDAMRTAADIIHDWFKWMDHQDGFVCNIGKLTILPGHVSVVPDKVTFCLEVRSLYDASIDEAYETLTETTRTYNDGPCSVSVKTLGRKPAVTLDTKLVEIIEKTAGTMGLNTVIMPSGASHDAAPMANVLPTAMIFVPSHNGISHSKEEFTPENNIICGATLLLNTLLEMNRFF